MRKTDALIIMNIWAAAVVLYTPRHNNLGDILFCSGALMFTLIWFVAYLKMKNDL